MSQTRPRRTAAAIVAVYVALAILGAVPASAHEGEGVLELEAQADAPGPSVPYVVRLTWADDGHPAIDATVTATAIDPSGTPQTPVPMQQQGDDGRYSATVAFPDGGAWTVRFTSVTPAATLEVEQDVSDPPPSTAASSTSSGMTSTTQESAGAGSSDGERASPPDGSEDDDGGIAGLLAALLLVLIVAGGLFGAIRARSSRST